MIQPALSMKPVLIFNSNDNKPLKIWSKKVSVGGGRIKRMVDNDLDINVLEILSPNINRTWLTCPGDPALTLGIRLSTLVLIVKNLHRSFLAEIQVLDDSELRRRFRLTSLSGASPLGTNVVLPCLLNKNTCAVPVTMVAGWNVIQLDLFKMTHTAFGTFFRETVRLQIHANCRLRQIYFCDLHLGISYEDRFQNGYMLNTMPK